MCCVIYFMSSIQISMFVCLWIFIYIYIMYTNIYTKCSILRVMNVNSKANSRPFGWGPYKSNKLPLYIFDWIWKCVYKWVRLTGIQLWRGKTCSLGTVLFRICHDLPTSCILVSDLTTHWGHDTLHLEKQHEWSRVSVDPCLHIMTILWVFQ